jgi:hypothetical protein
LKISTNIGNYVSECNESEGIVCPQSLKTGLFTTSAVDNIDHNPTSVTAKGSFHGTGISIFQHTEHDKPGIKRRLHPWNEMNSSSKFKIKELQDYYCRVPNVSDCPEPCEPLTTHSDIEYALAIEKRYANVDLHKLMQSA